MIGSDCYCMKYSRNRILKSHCCKIVLKPVVTQNSFQAVILLSVHFELKCDYIYLHVITSVVTSRHTDKIYLREHMRLKVTMILHKAADMPDS